MSLTDHGLRLSTFGSFSAGGEITPRRGTQASCNHVLRNQAYVEYFRPQELARGACPVVLTHNYFSGAAWLGNAEGREGWAQFFLRRGFPVFIVDPPGTGRAGFNPDDIERDATVIDGALPVDEGFWPGQDSSAWVAWNMGPEWGVAGDGVVRGNQMPTDDAAQRRLLATLTPNKPMPDIVVDAAFVHVLETVTQMAGPPIFVGWSMGGGLGQRLVCQRPDLIRALVLLDGYSGEKRFPEAGRWIDNGAISAVEQVAEVLVDRGIPLLNLNSATGHFSNTAHAGKLGETLVENVLQRRGVARTIWLPEVGIIGNGHMMFFEKNSDDIAAVLEQWIADTVLSD